MMSLMLTLLLAGLMAIALRPAEAAPVTPPEAARVQALAALLPPRPGPPGPPRTDRAAWEKLAALPDAKRVITQAEVLIKTPIPPQPDDLYLEYSRTGNRTRWQAVAGRRRGRLAPLALAECLENKGRFLPALNAIIEALCTERTWTLPAHDGALKNFHGTARDIDLGSSALAWDLAETDALLGDVLAPETRRRLQDNVRLRVLTPFRDEVEGKKTADWWLTGTNNWNAVCLAGVIGAALAESPTREERALYAAAGEKYIHSFLSGFTADGYCSEGLGYWDYGFGRFTLLAETLDRATGGGLDLLALPQAQAPARFPARIQIIGGVSPAFADCAVDARPQASVMRLLNARLGLGLMQYAGPEPGLVTGALAETLVYNFPRTRPAKGAAGASLTAPRLRDWFDRAGILVARPAPGTACRLGVALKGGNNAENHNHDDVGSYVVVAGDQPVLLDPGGETYTARTFSAHRYDSKLLNSWGHSVPLVAGKLQREGAEAHGQVLRTEFLPTRDTLEMDIASAYPVPALKSLRRTFVYSRAGTGSLSITDRAQFSSPQIFGTALITRGEWSRQPDGTLLIVDEDQAVRVTIDTGGVPFTLDSERIIEDAPVHPTRLGINLSRAAQSPVITVLVTPADLPTDRILLRNGGFENGAQDWNLPVDGMGAVVTDRAATGHASLQINDHDPLRGSDVSSAQMPVKPDADYMLRGQVFHQDGEGLGMYMRFFDADRNSLNTPDAHGNTAPIGTVKGTTGMWTPFSLHFHSPAGAKRMQLWIHSFNAAQANVYLDDLAITPGG